MALAVGPNLWHMEVPRLGVESELQLPACITATAMQDPNHICDLHYTSWQCQILNPLSKAMDQTHILMDANQIHFCSMMETPLGHVLINIQYVILLNISFSKHRLNLFRHVDFFRGTFLPLLKFHPLVFYCF